MDYSTLDTVVLNRDLPEHGLKIGDLGTIVEIYEPDGIEVEFVTASGRTGALLTLKVSDVRHVADADLVTVRQFARSA
jgi:pyridoxine 5'-phosphate synthase PdxJ